MNRLFLPLFIAIGLLASLWLLTPVSPAEAQAQGGQCTTITTTTYIYPSAVVDEGCFAQVASGRPYCPDDNDITSPGSLTGSPDAASATFSDRWGSGGSDSAVICASMALPQLISGSARIRLSNPDASDFGSNEAFIFGYGHNQPILIDDADPWGISGSSFSIPGWSTNTSLSSTKTVSGQFSHIAICVRNSGIASGGPNDFLLDAIQIEPLDQICETDAAQYCPLVENANFSEPDGWLLSGGAVISDGVLSLPSGGIAAQNLTPASNTGYTATISVTNVISSAGLDVVFGFENELLSISEPGTYTTTFTTSNLNGPLGYALDNQGPGDVEITYTCLESGSGKKICLAPDNGEFDDSSGWIYENGAAWNEATEAAFIPFNDPETHSDPFYTPAFLSNDTVISLPTILTGEHLLLSFEANSQTNQNGLVDNLVANGDHSQIFEFTAETFPTPYVYEMEITDLAGQEFNLLFGNNGGWPEVSHTADIAVDNVCIFVSDRGAELPKPVDEDAIDPVSLGSFYSCDDVEAILAGWGVDIRYWRTVYNDGVSIWDPVNWVPWLVAAWWNMVEIYLCTVIVAIATMINLAEYLLNNGLNIFAWVRRNIEAAIPWALSWLFDYGWRSILNFFDAGWFTSEGWLLWLAASLLVMTGLPAGVLIQIATLIYLWIGGGFEAVFAWLWGSTDYTARELRNAAVSIVNGIAPMWNGLITALEYMFSVAVDTAVGVWNDGLFPFIQTAWQYLAFVFLLGALPAVAMFLTFWDLLWAVMMWLWENVIQVVTLPISFYTGMQAGVNSTAFSDLLACSGSTTDFWCGYLAALDLVNNIAGHSIFYPIVIIGITFGTVTILWRQVGGLWTTVSDLIIRI